MSPVACEDRFAALECLSRFSHSRMRRPQKSRIARNTTFGFAPGRRAGRARVVRHSSSASRAAALLELDQQLGRQERAARLESHSLK
jgi:hypothetical protein